MHDFIAFQYVFFWAARAISIAYVFFFLFPNSENVGGCGCICGWMSLMTENYTLV